MSRIICLTGGRSASASVLNKVREALVSTGLPVDAGRYTAKSARAASAVLDSKWDRVIVVTDLQGVRQFFLNAPKASKSAAIRIVLPSSILSASPPTSFDDLWDEADRVDGGSSGAAAGGGGRGGGGAAATSSSSSASLPTPPPPAPTSLSSSPSARVPWEEVGGDAWDVDGGGKWGEGPAWLGATCLSYCSEGWEAREKVASFDVDGTISVDKGNEKKAARSVASVKLLGDVGARLKALHAAGWSIVFLTNQGGLYKGKQDKKSVQATLERVVELVDVPVLMLVASAYDYFRKPAAGMWHGVRSVWKAKGVELDEAQSFFVGDRDTDRLFASSVGIPFFTEREFLAIPTPSAPPLSPSRIPPMEITPGLRIVAAAAKGQTGFATFAVEPSASTTTTPDWSTWGGVVVLVGPPGAGKSHVSTQLFPHLERVNQDQLKSRDRCIRVARQHLQRGAKGVVVDATNRDVKTRKFWVDLAKECGVPARAVCVRTGLDLALHQATARASRGARDARAWTCTGEGDADRSVPERIVRMWFLAASWPSVRKEPPQDLLETGDISSITLGAKRPAPTPSPTIDTTFLTDLHAAHYPRKTGGPVWVKSSGVSEGFTQVAHIGVKALSTAETTTFLQSSSPGAIYKAAADSKAFPTPLAAALFATPNDPR